MGWRDRVKNSSAYSAYSAEGFQNLKKKENNNKLDFKTTLEPYTQYTQNTQIRPKQEEKEDSRWWVDSSEPKPEPRQTVQQQYETLWKKAWTLADFVDGDTALYEERIKRLPELLDMRDELSRLEQAEPQPPGSAAEPVQQTDVPMVHPTNPDTCPAQCKVSGRCYGLTYFLGKPGGSQDCSEPCFYASQLETFFKDKKDSQK
jgi:hypothetical protein